VKDYTVTIAPNDGEGATTVVKLQLDGSTPLIKELTLSAGNNAGLSIDQLPAIDLGALLAAVMPAATTSPITADTAAQSPAIAAPPAHDIDEVAPASPVPVTAAQPVSVARPATPVTPRRTRANTAPGTKAAAAAKATAATKGPAAKKAGVAKKTAGKKTPAGTTKQATKPGKPSAARTAPKRERAYRVMPEDFVNTFGKTTMADLAEVYQVPRHTIQAWVNTARKQGKIPPARSRSGA
jgi:hypothetical protein